MKTDLDALMQSRNIDALLVSGPGQHNPAMVYLNGGAHLTDAYLVKKRGTGAILFHRSMECDEAALSGLETRGVEGYDLDQIFMQARGDLTRVGVALLERILVDLEITAGRLAVFGQGDAGAAYAIFSGLAKALPDLEIVGGDTLLLEAMATKDDEEVARIRGVGEITAEVVGEVADYLTSRPVRGEALYKANGEPLTIGDVKNRIDLWLAERGAENPHGAIFAIGRDAGVPHSSGTHTDLLRLGQTIIFDIYPCERGGGYFHDFTRTWCLGYAPDEALALYEDVLHVYQTVVGALRPDAIFQDYQKMTCDLFRVRGHETILDDPLIESGYVHGLGHGVGLHVHERPFSRTGGDPGNILAPGVVFTIEPGLYYPEPGLGVRLEDTYWMNPAGGAELLVEYPLELVLEMGK